MRGECLYNATRRVYNKSDCLIVLGKTSSLQWYQYLPYKYPATPCRQCPQSAPTPHTMHMHSAIKTPRTVCKHTAIKTTRVYIYGEECSALNKTIKKKQLATAIDTQKQLLQTHPTVPTTYPTPPFSPYPNQLISSINELHISSHASCDSVYEGLDNAHNHTQRDTPKKGEAGTKRAKRT